MRSCSLEPTSLPKKGSDMIDEASSLDIPTAVRFA